MREREYSKMTLEVFSLRKRKTGVTSLTSEMGEGWGREGWPSRGKVQKFSLGLVKFEISTKYSNQ